MPSQFIKQGGPTKGQFIPANLSERSFQTYITERSNERTHRVRENHLGLFQQRKATVYHKGLHNILANTNAIS